MRDDVTPPTLEALCDVLWEVESDFGLLDVTVADVKVWQAARMAVYYKLAKATGLLEEPQKGHRKTGLAHKTVRLLREARGVWSGSPLKGADGVDAIVVESARSQVVDGRAIDIYTDHLRETFEKDGTRFLLLDPSDEGRHVKPPHPRRRYLDGCDLLEAALGRIVPTYTRAQRALLGEVTARFHRDLGVTVDIEGFFKSVAALFRVRYRYFDTLFKLRPAKEIYIVCSYAGMAPVTRAAKDNGILVKELQHGTLSRYHLGYSFPHLAMKDSLSYFPDVFLAWSDYWKRKIDWPIPDSAVVDYGFKYLETQQRRYAGLERRHNQIVVLSQGAVGARLADAVLANIDALKDHTVVYKLHPGEYARWQSYDSLVALSRRGNVSIATDCDLYALFATSEIQIGVYSTAIYEGMAFGLKTVLVPLPGVEYMADLLADGSARLLAEFTADLLR